MKSRTLRIVLILAIVAIAGAAGTALRLGQSTPAASATVVAAPAPAATGSEAGGYGVERSFGSPRRASFL